MNMEDFLDDVEFERGFDMDDDCVMNYRERNGEYRLGRVEMDPEMDHFDELVHLARSLRSR